MKLERFEGCWTAMVTPFHRKGEVDFEGLEKNLMRDELALIDHRQRRQRAEVEKLGRIEAERFDRVERAFANHIELALQRLSIVDSDAAFDKNLANRGHAASRDIAAFSLGDRNGAPSQDALPFFADDLLKGGLAGGALIGIEGQKCLPYSVVARLREIEPALVRLALQELVRKLDEDSSAVSGARIASACSAMRQVVEHLQRLEHDVVRALAGYIDDKSNSACVVLMRRVVQALSPWNAVAIVHGSTSASNR